MKPLYLRIGVVAAIAALTCCLFGCTLGHQNESATFVGAFHPLTGMNEPLEYGATSEDVEQARENLLSNEVGSDKKTIFVAVRVYADDEENKIVGIVDGTVKGATVADAELTVDDTNSYHDNYGLNDRGYFETLEQIGYHDGAKSCELLGGSGETYSAIFMFDISNHDFEEGETAHLEWGEYSVDFNMSDIQEVDSPIAMVDALRSA